MGPQLQLYLGFSIPLGASFAKRSSLARLFPTDFSSALCSTLSLPSFVAYCHHHLFRSQTVCKRLASSCATLCSSFLFTWRHALLTFLLLLLLLLLRQFGCQLAWRDRRSPLHIDLHSFPSPLLHAACITPLDVFINSRASRTTLHPFRFEQAYILDVTQPHSSSIWLLPIDRHAKLNIGNSSSSSPCLSISRDTLRLETDCHSPVLEAAV